MLSSFSLEFLFAVLDTGHGLSQPDLFAGIAFIATITLVSALLMFHSPHDVIEDIRIAYGPSREKTVFVISRHNLLQSSEDSTWKRLTNGLDPFKLSSLILSPSFATDQTLFVASFGGGVYRSKDGGASWAACNNGIADAHIVLLGISPDFEQSGSVFALGRSGALYRSRDGGNNWETMTAAPKHMPADSELAPPLTLNDDDEELLDPIRDAGEAWKKCHRRKGITCIGFANNAMVAGTTEGKLYASQDGGTTWNCLASLPGNSEVTCIEIPHGAALEDIFFVGTKFEGVYRILEAGSRVEPAKQIKPLTQVTALGSFRDTDGRLNLLACSWDEALFISYDAGASWVHKRQGLTKHRQADEQRFGAPHFNAIAVYTGSTHAETYIGGFDGLFQTTDFDQWTSVETLPLGIVTSFALSPSIENNFSIALANYGAGVSILSNAAQADPVSWQIRNNGLPTTRLGAISFSPEFGIDHTLFVACESHVLRSMDGGDRWQKIALHPAATKRGFSVRLFNQIRAAERLLTKYLSSGSLKILKALFQAFTLRLGGRVSHFVFPSVFAFSPEYRKDQTLFVGTRAHGVFRSQDAGNSFSQVWDCMGRYVFSLAVSPGYSSDQTIFASVSDGLYRSRDGGLTWHSEKHEEPFRNARLAISPAYEEDGTLFAGGQSGLLRSRERGLRWQAITVDTKRPSMAVGGIALSPAFKTDGCMLVYGYGQGLYFSNNGGVTFERLPWHGLSNDHAFSQMLCFPDASTLFQFSPNYPEDNTLVAVSMDQVYKSNNSGLSWTNLPKPTRYEDSRPEMTFQGRWSVAFNEAFSSQRAHCSSHHKNEASLTFVGTEVTWIGTKGPNHGMANVFMDKVLRATVDLYAPELTYSVALFSATLPQGLHTITVQVHDQKNALSFGCEVWIDALDVKSGTLA